MLEPLQDAHLWIARLDDTIVAFAIIEREADETWLESLAVDPPHRGRGIGGVVATQALLGSNMGEGRSAGLSVSSANAAARKLYAQLGFEQRSERPRFGIMRDDLLARITADQDTRGRRDPSD